MSQALLHYPSCPWTPGSKARQSNLRTLLVGWLVYPLGDLSAQIILGHINLWRVVTIAVVGGVIYRFEVPKWFACLDKCAIDELTVRRFVLLRCLVRPKHGARGKWQLNCQGRTLGAIIYFNPLWVARHMFFISLPGTIGHAGILVTLVGCLPLGVKSFAMNIPLSLIGNYIIQDRISLKWRFLASAVMSGLFACLYALEYTVRH